MRRIVQILSATLAGCVAIRIVAWLIDPALPTLAVVTIVTATAYRLVAGPRFKGFDKYLK